MSFLAQSKLAADKGMLDRVTACAATLGVRSPGSWAYENQWPLSTQPGWVEAYEAAFGAGVEDPGEQPDVITDTMISTAVTALLSKEPPSV